MSGAERCGKSALLAWLVAHGSREGTPEERCVHAVVPRSGESLLGTVWALADQLGVVARAPDELVEALTADPRRTVIVLPDLGTRPVAELVLALSQLPQLRLIVETRTGSAAHALLTEANAAELNLDLDRWTDQRRLATWRAGLPHDVDLSPAVAVVPASVNLAEPASVCAADAWTVTAAYEADSEDHGGLRMAWLKAGQSLCREQDPASRALVLLTALGDSADPRLRPALAVLAEGAPWRVEWNRVMGDVSPPWPGPVTALAMGSGPIDNCLLSADHQGTVRVLNVSDAGPRGRFTPSAMKSTAMSVLPDGTVLLLDESGRVHVERSWAVRPAASGLEALLNDKPHQTDHFIGELREHSGTVLTVTSGERPVAALGDAEGRVRAFGDTTDVVRLHIGRVAALSALNVLVDDEAGSVAPLVYSGGVDGTVRAWAPGHEPMAAPLAERRCPVVALHASDTREGPALVVAWDDGLVELHRFNSGEVLSFRPGPPVRGVVTLADGSLVIGMDEALIRIAPRTAQAR
ncbi:hypothetical protein OG949_17300 [Streptomyces scopuliridis]|uniref:hypothetical protein n=1 Tax=Streptomyces scopuliridis TaxID=452529 RepID=UPI002DDC5ADE|nr:hypothetical protein [Streptomyces scopuliridis]WSB34457.1 hypothetical protein OG949_17300 [Streptomyces scopuliridis]